MGGNRDYENLPLAAVVHDIGKFWKGTGGDGEYQEMDAEFIRMHFPGKCQGVSWIA